MIAWLLSNPTILAIGFGVIAAAGAWFKGRLSGAKAERLNQVAAEARARDIADQVDNDIGALPVDAAKKELGTWSPKS